MEEEQEYFDSLIEAGYSMQEIEMKIIKLRLTTKGIRC